jgi:glucose-1-phosphate cytidylyltransferase
LKTVILAGGFGTRLSEYTDSIPKPMVTIGGKPILWHIMNTYASFGHDDFYLALGYKADVVKDYFLNYYTLNSDFTINLNSGEIQNHQASKVNWNVTLVDTGLMSMTGGRLKRLKNYIGNETFMMTYGDGLADVNIDNLLEFHKKHGKMVTMTGVHPQARFGELDLDGNSVVSFREKPSAQTKQGWINGGYMVFEPEFLNLIDGDSTILEQEPLKRVSELSELMVYRHSGFWQCMDTKRDRDILEDLWRNNNVKWQKI